MEVETAKILKECKIFLWMHYKIAVCFFFILKTHFIKMSFWNEKYQTLIKKCEKAGIKHLDKSNPNAFIEYSSTMDDVYNNINGYDTLRKRKMLITPDHMISHINTNKKFQAIFK